MLGLLDEPDDFLLDLARQLEMLHSGIYCVNFLLEYDSLLVDVVDQDSQLSEQISLCYSSHDVYYRNKQQLLIITSSKVVSKQEEATGVKRNPVHIQDAFVEEGPLVFPTIEVVQRWYPFFLSIDEIKPNASNEMDIHQQEENQLDQFN